MPVRNSAKAIVLSKGRVLVNRCTSRFGDYYALPGGGQREGETLLAPVRAYVDREEYARDNTRRTKIVAAQLFNDAGIVGAACLGKQNA